MRNVSPAHAGRGWVETRVFTVGNGTVSPAHTAVWLCAR